MLATAQGVWLFAILFAAAAADWRERQVPRWLCLLGAAGGLGFCLLRGGAWGGGVSLLSGLSACGVGLGLFLLLQRFGGMGGSETRLAAALGAMTGEWRFLLWCLFWAALAGLPLAAATLVAKEGVGETLRRCGRALLSRRSTAAPVTVPYAVALLAGTLAAVFWLVAEGKKIPVF